MKQNRAISSRIADIRFRRNWSQKHFGRLLADELNLEKPFSISTVSTWETGRRPVPACYLDAMSKICGVSKAWLLGLTNDENKVTADTLTETDDGEIAQLKTEIPSVNLYQWNKQPIYVEFLTYRHESGWGIYDDENKKICFPDISITVNEALLNSVKIYSKQPDYSYQIGAEGRKMLEFSKIKTMDWVYILMNSPSKEIRSMYNGWYHHNETHSCLINAIGLTLPYSGYGVSYSAYSMDESYGRKNFRVEDVLD